MAKRSKSNQFDRDEMYRQLRTNIQFSNMDTKIKVVNIVSTTPNEGKSTIAANLARVSAEHFEKVLIIDCDLRNPTLHKLFKMSKGEGLTNLVERFSEGDSILRAEELRIIGTESGKKFYFISSGARVPNPLEVVSSNSFLNVIKQAKEEFDFVILDCPPISLCSDGIPISNACDGTLYAVSGKETDKRQAKAAMKDLQRSGVNIIGLCLTKMENLMNKKYYYYGYGNNNQEEE